MTGTSPPSVAPLRVALVEDDRTTREGLALLIGGTAGYECEGRYSSVEDALRGTLDPAPDVWLVDVKLPGTPGSAGVALMRARYPTSEVLMLTAVVDDDAVFASICNGAVGYLLKTTPPSRLIESIREAAQGGAPMSPAIARRVVTLFRKSPPPRALDEALTPQELRMLQQLAAGHSYQVAADHLGISINTVRSYVRTVYDKLHVHSKSAAVSKAMRLRLID